MTDAPSLPEMKADCSRCTGLCCASFAFERSAMFAADKAVNEPCRHLGEAFECTIHDRLDASGYRGCRLFDCRGAGQRVTHELFPGRDWRRDAGLAGRMFEAFRNMNRVHECLELVLLLSTLPLDTGGRQACSGFLAALQPQGGWDETSLKAFPYERTRKDILAFAASLKGSSAAAGLAGNAVRM